MGRKGTISGTKGAVTGINGFGLVKGRRLGREGRHFFCRKDAKTDEKGTVMEGKGAPSLT